MTFCQALAWAGGSPSGHPRELMQWLGENYRLEESRGYAEQEETYRKVKDITLHRPSYRYKAVLQRFGPK